MDFRHGGFWGGFNGNGPGVFGILMFVVFWAALALLILLLVQSYRHGPRHLHELRQGPAGGPVATQSTANPAIDILKERFARGEVSEEEYTRRLNLLKDS
jgi:putative membrane protein